MAKRGVVCGGGYGGFTCTWVCAEAALERCGVQPAASADNDGSGVLVGRNSIAHCRAFFVDGEYVTAGLISKWLNAERAR